MAFLQVFSWGGRGGFVSRENFLLSRVREAQMLYSIGLIKPKTFSRNHQLSTRLPPSFLLIQCGFVRRNFIGHRRWNGRESTNQLRQHISHIATLYFMFHLLPYTISPGYCPDLVILNISPASLPNGTAFLCFSGPPRFPGCAKDHEQVILYQRYKYIEM